MDDVQCSSSNLLSKHMTPDSVKVREFWSERKPPTEITGGYLYSPITRPYIIKTAYDQDASDTYSHSSTWAWDIFIDRYLSGRCVKRVLSLSCGFGVAERILLSKLPEITDLLALDIAPGAIATAQRLANEAGFTNVRYEVADLNSYAWPVGEYDLVVANGSLHHLSNLEDVLAGVHKALKSGGVFFSCEYVGPNYMDHSPRQLELINSTAFIISPALRARTGLSWHHHPRIFNALNRLYTAVAREDQPHWSSWKKLVARATRSVVRKPEFDFGVVHISPKSHLLRTDPSECVRSSDVLPLVRRFFPEVEIRQMGGGILEFALDACFYEKYDPHNEHHQSDFDLACDIERHYMATGEIGSDFALIIAQLD